MRAVPFPVRGSASSGMVIHWAPYRNWTLCAWSHTALKRRVRKRFSLGFGITPLVTEQVPEPENEENEWSTQYQKWDFALPVLVPVLEMGLSFPVLVNCAFGHLHVHQQCFHNKIIIKCSPNLFD